MPSQEIFKTVYRGRQSSLHHLADMRMAKVLLEREALHRAAVDLADKRIFDYGFGAGTFFRYCPTTASLFGVEIDAQNVAEVRHMLSRRGFRQVQLESIVIEEWDRHPLLRRQYDVMICSHVLEDLDSTPLQL